MKPTATWYNKNKGANLSVSPDPFKGIKNEKLVLGNLKDKYDKLQIKETGILSSNEKK